jgi:hypothetical protein
VTFGPPQDVARRATFRAMTTEGTATLPASDTATDDGALHCYRHPDRETWVRCGRCDRPICTKCAMQGPVGFRCRDCGKPVIDPLTSMKPRQVVLGGLVSVAAATLGGVIAMQLGFWAIFVGFFAGGLVADVVMRVTGYKRGPVMVTILLGGIALGALIAVGLSYGMFIAAFMPIAGEEPIDYPFVAYLLSQAPWAIVYAGAAMAGAWGRLRF